MGWHPARSGVSQSSEVKRASRRSTLLWSRPGIELLSLLMSIPGGTPCLGLSASAPCVSLQGGYVDHPRTSQHTQSNGLEAYAGEQLYGYSLQAMTAPAGPFSVRLLETRHRSPALPTNRREFDSKPASSQLILTLKRLSRLRHHISTSVSRHYGVGRPYNFVRRYPNPDRTMSSCLARPGLGFSP